MVAPTEIPKRAFFKSAEVCAIAGVQPYVLKSWETEFPSLGGKKRKDGSRVYGRPEVELVLEIKELVYGEGLTLGAARRKLREQTGDEAETVETVVDDDQQGISDEVRQKLAGVKKGLHEILDLLSGDSPGSVQKPLGLEDSDSEKAARAGATSQPKSARREQSSDVRESGSVRGKTGTKRKRRTA